MQIIITDAWWARTKVLHLHGSKLLAMLLAATALVVLLSVVLTVSWVGSGRFNAGVQLAQQDRFVRENLDTLAKRIGEMQVKLMQLDALGDRVSGLAGLSASDLKDSSGRGGVLVPQPELSAEQLAALLDEMERQTGHKADLLTVVESRLFDQKMRRMMVPTQAPIAQPNLGSAFGWRIDPITGASALHTGLDFQADTGTPILAAAGGLVVTQEYHAQYGNMLEVDHGNKVVTRYAHASRVLVKKGDVVKRGQRIAEVGSTGRSTGAHLHFEVLVEGVMQDPQKFLNAGKSSTAGGLPLAKGAGKAGFVQR